MERVKTKSYRAISTILLSFLFLIGGLYCNSARAYFVGTHTAPSAYGPNFVFSRPAQHNKVYWTGWKRISRSCKQNCLVDDWSGRVIRCKKMCRR